ncbi:MAG: hypothetical protein O3A81_02750 [bacterium]|nr:hypothetical protein [bacterium]
MLHDFYDRYSFLSPEPRPEYPALPIEVRLKRWFEKSAKRSAFMRDSKTQTHMTLRKGIATTIGLKSARVTIEQRGNTVVLLSSERDSPLAELSTTSTAPVMTQQPGSHENFLRGAPDTGDSSPEHIGLTSPHISRDPRKD